MSSKEVTFGKTKIFIKSPKTVSWRLHLHLVGAAGENWRACLREKLGGEGSIYNLEWVEAEEVSLQGLNPWVPTLPGEPWESGVLTYMDHSESVQWKRDSLRVWVMSHSCLSFHILAECLLQSESSCRCLLNE